MKILIMTAALVIASSSGVAATGKGEGSKGKAAETTLYCLGVEGTGSRLATKVCMTEQQWRAEGVSVTRK